MKSRLFKTRYLSHQRTSLSSILKSDFNFDCYQKSYYRTKVLLDQGIFLDQVLLLIEYLELAVQVSIILGSAYMTFTASSCTVLYSTCLVL